MIEEKITKKKKEYIVAEELVLYHKPETIQRNSSASRTEYGHDCGFFDQHHPESLFRHPSGSKGQKICSM